MHNFDEIINDYMTNITKIHDKRIMQEAVNLIESEPIILDEELEVLNEIFIGLKNDYTLKVITDPITLDFCIALVKQEPPIIKNKHNINILVNELKRIKQTKQISKIEELTLTFLEASEHVEENEILLIQNIVRYLNNDWILQPMQTNEENIRYSRIIPTYSKQLIKK